MKYQTSTVRVRCASFVTCLAVAFAVTIAIVSGGCDSTKASDKSLVFVSPEDGARLAAGERNLLGASTSGAWVDARTRADYDAGHIPGAISMPFERVTQDSYMLKDKGTLIVYGADYNDARANGMSKRLRELLSDADIRTLDGGVRAWTAAGHELEK